MRTLQRNQKGFTMLEALIVVAILGVMSAMGVTLYTGLVARSSLDTFTNNMTNAVRLARTRAIGDMDTMMVCPTVNGTTCADNAEAYGLDANSRGGILIVRRVVQDPGGSGGSGGASTPTVSEGEVVRFVEGVRKIRVEGVAGDGKITFTRNGQPLPTFSGLKLRVGYYDREGATKAVREQVICVNRTGVFSVLPISEADSCDI